MGNLQRLPTKPSFNKALVFPMLLGGAVMAFLAWEYDPRGLLFLLEIPLVLPVVVLVSLPLWGIKMLIQRSRRPAQPKP